MECGHNVMLVEEREGFLIGDEVFIDSWFGDTGLFLCSG